MKDRDFELCCFLYQINEKFNLPHDIVILIIKITINIEKPVLFKKARDYHCQRLINPSYGIATKKISIIRSLSKILGDDFRRHLEKQSLINSHIYQLYHFKKNIAIYHNNHIIIRRRNYNGIYKRLLRNINICKYKEDKECLIKLYNNYEKMLIKW